MLMESMAQMLLVTTENNIDPSTGKKKKKNTWTELVFFFPLTESQMVLCGNQQHNADAVHSAQKSSVQEPCRYGFILNIILA